MIFSGARERFVEPPEPGFGILILILFNERFATATRNLGVTTLLVMPGLKYELEAEKDLVCEYVAIPMN